jgi:hypothetical protein
VWLRLTGPLVDTEALKHLHLNGIINPGNTSVVFAGSPPISPNINPHIIDIHFVCFTFSEPFVYVRVFTA